MTPPPSSEGPRNVRRKPAPSSPDSLPPASIDAPESVAPRVASRLLGLARAAFGVALVVSLAGVLAWGARHYVRTSTRFAVSEIVTTGAARRSAAEIALTAGVDRGQNVFTLDLDRARARLIADPWIKDAKVSRQLPGTVFLHVVEFEAAGILATGEGTYLLTREGTIIKKVEPDDPTDLDVVTGVALEDLVSDREGATRTVRRALDLASDYEHSPLAKRSPLQEVHVEHNGDMSLVIGKSTVTLKLGASPYRRKLEQAARVVAELDRRGAKPDTVMLDNDARPERVVVRVR